MNKATLYIGHEDGGCVDIGELVLANGYAIYRLPKNDVPISDDKPHFDFSRTPNSGKDWLTSVDGLPPVGEKIEYSCHFSDGKISIIPGQWYQGTIIAYHEGAVWTSDNGIRQLDNTIFRPLKSERERAIEEILSIVDTVNVTNEQLAELIYDAGFKKEGL